jgi:hypothetical protein
VRRLSKYQAPGELAAGERAWSLVQAAFEAREPVAWPRRHARPLVAGALVAAVVVAVLSPPGRSVVHSLRKAVGIEKAQPALFSLPTRGQLLVTSPSGAWLVRPDGSKRLLGRYRDAAFSPSGLFVVATRANELAALDPKGTEIVRWALARPNPRFPAWTGTRTDTRIAYLSGGRVRVVAGDGTGDRVLARAAPVAPVWRPGPTRVLTYSTGRAVVVEDVEARAVLLRLRPGAAPTRLAWSDDGRRLLVFTRRGLLAFDRSGRLVLRRGAVAAAFAPGTHRLAAIRVHGAQSDVFQARSGRLLFRGTGVFRQLAWSPNGRWLLITWPTANQWVFLRTRPRKIVASARISAQFDGFPRVAGWCCGAR